MLVSELATARDCISDSNPAEKILIYFEMKRAEPR